MPLWVNSPWRTRSEPELALEKSQTFAGGHMGSKAVIDAPPKQLTVVSNSKPQRATNEEIALRAYDLFIQRGGSHGSDVQDWLQAEKDLKRT